MSTQMFVLMATHSSTHLFTHKSALMAVHAPTHLSTERSAHTWLHTGSRSMNMSPTTRSQPPCFSPSVLSRGSRHHQPCNGPWHMSVHLSIHMSRHISRHMSRHIGLPFHMSTHTADTSHTCPHTHGIHMPTQLSVLMLFHMSTPISTTYVYASVYTHVCKHACVHTSLLLCLQANEISTPCIYLLMCTWLNLGILLK